MPAYLDHAATTPMRPEAIDAMMPFLADTFGNPSASHRWGREARRALDDARDTMADVLGAQPGEVVFTSGGTEADNQAIVGVLARTGGVAVCSAIEHHAVLEPVERSGGRVVAVGPDGRIDLGGLADALDEDVAVVSIMLVNNEVGVIQPFDQIATLVRQRAPRAVLHTDAVQAFTWLDVASVAADADLISVSAHKFGGPKGVGAFVIRDGTSIDPLLFGGGQERDRRSGTQNVAGVVAMAAAARSAADRARIAGRPAHPLARPTARRAPRRPPRHRRDRRHRHPPQPRPQGRRLLSRLLRRRGERDAPVPAGSGRARSVCRLVLHERRDGTVPRVGGDGDRPYVGRRFLAAVVRMADNCGRRGSGA